MGWILDEPQGTRKRRGEGAWGGCVHCGSAAAKSPPPTPRSRTLALEGVRGPGVGGWAGGQGRTPLRTRSCLRLLFCPRAAASPASPLPGGAPALTAIPTRASGACNQ